MTDIEVKKEMLLSVTKNDVRLLKQQYDLFRELQHQVLEEGVDYGFPAGKKSQDQKPSLYKSGAEKLTRLFNLIPEFQILEKVEKDDFIMYAFRCILKTRDGLQVGEGYGACNSKEKPGWNSNPWAFQNNILKMAKKRAHVDATLTGLGASNVFTQDLEDMADENMEQKIPVQQTAQQTQEGVTEKQSKMIHVLIKQVAEAAGCSIDDVIQDIKDKWNVQSSKELTKEQASRVIEHLQTILANLENPEQ